MRNTESGNRSLKTAGCIRTSFLCRPAASRPPKFSLFHGADTLTKRKIIATIRKYLHQMPRVSRTNWKRPPGIPEDAHRSTGSGIEVVITGLTRNHVTFSKTEYLLYGKRIEVVITSCTRNLAGSCPFRPPKTLYPCGFYPVRKLNKFAVLSVSSFQSPFSSKKRGKTAAEHIGSGIEVVITGLTRNQVVLTGSWVRIPPARHRKIQ